MSIECFFLGGGSVNIFFTFGSVFHFFLATLEVGSLLLVALWAFIVDVRLSARLVPTVTICHPVRESPCEPRRWTGDSATIPDLVTASSADSRCCHCCCCGGDAEGGLSPVLGSLSVCLSVCLSVVGSM